MKQFQGRPFVGAKVSINSATYLVTAVNDTHHQVTWGSVGTQHTYVNESFMAHPMEVLINPKKQLIKQYYDYIRRD